MHFHDPLGLPALVGQQAEPGHKAADGPHQVDDAGIAVAPGRQHRVSVDHGGGFRPRQNVALFRDVAHLVHVAGAGEGVLLHQAQLL